MPGGAAGSVVSGVLTPVKAAVSSALNAVTPRGAPPGRWQAWHRRRAWLRFGSGRKQQRNATELQHHLLRPAGRGNSQPFRLLSRLAGIGALPGLADLPSVAGLTTMRALNGDTGGGVPMPATALSAATAPPMSSNSFAALAVGALLAGASALKIAGRRVRDRRTGLE